MKDPDFGPSKNLVLVKGFKIGFGGKFVSVFRKKKFFVELLKVLIIKIFILGKLLASCHCLEKLSLASWSNTGIQDLAALIVQNAATLKVMAIRVVKFSSGGYKIRKILS